MLGAAGESCQSHGRISTKKCIQCHTGLCQECHHFLINSRPWCPGCAKQHLPNLGDDARRALKGLAKLALLLIIIGLPLLLLPSGWWFMKMTGAGVIGTIMAKVLLLGDTASLQIDEYRGGREVRSIRREV